VAVALAGKEMQLRHRREVSSVNQGRFLTATSTTSASSSSGTSTNTTATAASSSGKVTLTDEDVTASNFPTINIELCHKKEATECSLWNSVFDGTNFECRDYAFVDAYDLCKSQKRHDYCGCDSNEGELNKLVNDFLLERQKKNWIRYGGRPYPAPRRVGSGFIELALCLKDQDEYDKSLLICRDCEFMNMRSAADACGNSDNSTKMHDYCGCSEPMLLEYYDALDKIDQEVAARAQQQQLQNVQKVTDAGDAYSLLPKGGETTSSESNDSSDTNSDSSSYSNSNSNDSNSGSGSESSDSNDSGPSQTNSTSTDGDDDEEGDDDDDTNTNDDGDTDNTD